MREGIVFHDGTPFDAEAVKYNIERAKTLPLSRRKGELAPIERVEVVNPSTVRLVLSAPWPPGPHSRSSRDELQHDQHRPADVLLGAGKMGRKLRIRAEFLNIRQSQLRTDRRCEEVAD